MDNSSSKCRKRKKNNNCSKNNSQLLQDWSHIHSKVVHFNEIDGSSLNRREKQVILVQSKERKRRVIQ